MRTIELIENAEEEKAYFRKVLAMLGLAIDTIYGLATVLPHFILVNTSLLG